MINKEGNRDEDAIAIARAVFQAYADKNRDALERIVGDDFHFTSPLDNRIDRNTYFDRCWPNSEWIDGFDFIHLVPDGDRVFVTYEGRSATRGRFRNTEILTISNGRLVNVEVYFGWGIPHKAGLGGFVDVAESQG
jgi:SnoaL-like domain